MCGVVGIFSYHPDAPGVNHAELITIRDSMESRGPDGKGEWHSNDNRIAFGHRRLSIIDLSERASQPMKSSDGKLIISFNGEIYNYKELRKELEKKGRQFVTDSDTEVLLHLYSEKGEAMVHSLRGMYAFIIWDNQNKGLFAARDPFGIKPLYYADDGKTIRLASQVKALLAGGKIDRTFEPAGQAGFFLWGHVPEPFTLYKAIRSLPAGSALWIDGNGKKRIKKFFRINEEMQKQGAFSEKLQQSKLSLREALEDSVYHHLIADVPVGVFLSSGLDSATLTGYASGLADKLQTVTLGFKEYQNSENDEVSLAEKIAQLYGTLHHTVQVSKEDFSNEASSLFKAMDQPTIDGVNSYFVSKASASTGLKVAISGIGGDELFGGYPGFNQIPRMVSALKPFSAFPSIGKLFRAISAPAIKSMTSPKYASMLEYGGSYEGAYILRRGMFMPWELPELIGTEAAKEGLAKLNTLSELSETIKGINKSNQKISALEMEWYMRNQLLRDADWASMAHSLEIRVPLVDVNLFRTVTSAQSTVSYTKQDMAMSLDKQLPKEILNRKKTGFSVPVREWLLNSDAHSGSVSDRGLRSWAKKVYNAETGINL